MVVGRHERDQGEPVFERVRPYTRTRGRTRPTRDLPPETLITATTTSPHRVWLATPGHARVLALCATTRSVAEIATYLALPLGVARVLISDLADHDAITVHATTPPADTADTTDTGDTGDTRPSMELMQHVPRLKRRTLAPRHRPAGGRR
jgi:hypothetical protein